MTALLPLGIRAQFKKRVSIRLFITTDAYSNRVMSDTTVTLMGHVEYSTKRMTNQEGEQVETSIQLYIPDVPGLTPEGEVTLPDGTTPRIRALKRLEWPSGAIHLELGF